MLSLERCPWRAASLLAATLTIALGGAPQALAKAAAKPPTVHTGAASAVSYGSATLNGSLDPRGQATYYYFQYGPTGAYGDQTGLAEAGSGTASVKVSVPIAGLSPLTIYHYRLVAVSGAGTTFGSDRELKTTKIPLSLAIVASPNPVAYGDVVQVQGTLSGTGAANREVVLQAAPYPFTTFADVGNPELTSATGSFSFVTLGATLSTQYRSSRPPTPSSSVPSSPRASTSPSTSPMPPSSTTRTG